MAILLFALGKVMSGHVANMAQFDVLMALQWGTLYVMACFVALMGARSVKGGMGAERGLGLLMPRLPI
jgi:hypothetical protein